MARAVRPPRVDRVPRRMRIAGRARRRVGPRDERQHLGQRRRQQHRFRGRRRRRKQRVVMPRDQSGVELRAGEGVVRDHPLQKGDVGRHAHDLVLRERLGEAPQRHRAVLAVGDELGDHRVVIRRDLVAGAHARIHAHADVRRRRAQVHERADRRQEAALGILGVDARLDGMAVDRQLVLPQREPLARGHPELPLDEIDAGDHFGDRMLDLQPRIHLHEVEPAVLLGDELDGARADVADRLRRRDRGFAHRAAALRRHAGCRRLFQHLLVAPLHRAVALEQVHGVAVRIAEHLDLDVPRRGQVSLEQHAIVAEGRLGLALRGRERRREVLAALDDLHALAAAAGGRLDQHRVADARGLPREQARRPDRRRDNPARAARRPRP